METDRSATRHRCLVPYFARCLPSRCPQRCRVSNVFVRKEPIRFDSFRFWIFRKVLGSVRFGSEKYVSQFDTVRPVFLPTRRGSVPFVSASGSASGSGWFQNYTFRFGLVRFGRFGSVPYSILNLVSDDVTETRYLRSGSLKLEPTPTMAHLLY